MPKYKNNWVGTYYLPDNEENNKNKMAHFMTNKWSTEDGIQSTESYSD